MSHFQRIAESYIAIWNETDPAARRALVSELFTEQAGFTDPLVAVRGWDGIDEFIGGVQARFTGLVFSLPGNVDGHHDTARFTWHLGAAGTDDPLAIGFDVIAIEDSRISQVYGFLDKVPG